MIVHVRHPVPAAPGPRGPGADPAAFAQAVTPVALREAGPGSVERVDLARRLIDGRPYAALSADGPVTPSRLAAFLAGHAVNDRHAPGLREAFRRGPALAGWVVPGPRERRAWGPDRRSCTSRGSPDLAPDVAALPEARRALAAALDRDIVLFEDCVYRRSVPLARPRTGPAGIEWDTGLDPVPDRPFPVRPSLLRALTAHLRPERPPAEAEIAALEARWPDRLVGHDDFLRLACGLPDLLLPAPRTRAPAPSEPEARLGAFRTRARLGSVAEGDVAFVLLAARDVCAEAAGRGERWPFLGLRDLLERFAIPAWDGVRGVPEDDRSLDALAP